MELTLDAESSLPLDECLVATLTLTGGTEGGRASARLNLIEGDVRLSVTGPDGSTSTCAWPWPTDAMPRSVDLAPGQRLIGTVPLVATDTSAPLFPSPGPYVVTATFDVAASRTLTAPTVTIRRTAPGDLARASALGERDVLQSLLSASPLGDALDDLETLATATTVTTRALVALALDRLDQLVETLDTGDAGTVDELVRAVVAVLPAPYSNDSRRAVIATLAADDVSRATLDGTPI